MRRADRVCAGLLVAGGIGLLVSLYLPWRTRACDSSSTCRSVDGWSSVSGEVLGLVALVLAAFGVASFVRSDLLDRLPIGRSALFAGYLVLASTVATGSELTFGGGSAHLGRGAYLAIFATVVVGLASVDARIGALSLHGRVWAAWAILAAAVALLALLLSTWQQAHIQSLTFSVHGVFLSAAIAAAGLAVLAVAAWWRAPDGPAVDRLVLPLAVPLFAAGAAFGTQSAPGIETTAARWFALGAALALALVAVIAQRPLAAPSRPSAAETVALAGGAVVVAGLFVPWSRQCGVGIGCQTANAWQSTPGVLVALLVAALAVVVLWPGRIPVSAIELAAGIAVLVVTIDRSVFPSSDLESGSTHGSLVAYIGLALLVVPVLLRVRLPIMDRGRAPVAAGGLAASAVYLALVLVPWWAVLPGGIRHRLLIAPPTLPALVGVLLAVRVVRLWLDYLRAEPRDLIWIVVVPTAMLTLVVVELVRIGAGLGGWGWPILVVDCLVLVLLGEAARREYEGVPAVLRVDRL